MAPAGRKPKTGKPRAVTSRRLDRDLARAIPDLLFLLDPEGVFLDYKGEAGDLYAAPSEFIGRKVTAVLPPALAKRTMAALRRALESGEPVSFEYELEVAGDLRFYDARLTGCDGKVLVLARDVSERKRAERALRESELKFRALFEGAPVGMGLSAPDGRILAVNGSLARRLGYAASEIVGGNCRCFYSDPARREAAMAKMEAEGEVRDFEVTLNCRDGSVFPAELNLTPLDFGGSRVLVSVIRDITERRQAEKDIRESEEKYRRLFEAQRDAVIICDAVTRRIVDVNDSACRLYGYGREEMMGMDAVKISNQPEETLACLNRTLANGTDHVTARYHRRRDGTVFPVELTTAAFDWRDGRVVCGIFRDIGHRLKMEDELRRANRQLLRALEEVKQTQERVIQHERLGALGQMASGIAHDFNNALMPILGFTDMLLSDPETLTDRQRAEPMLQAVRTAARSAAQSVRRLRQFYRPSDDVLQLPVKLDRVIRDVVALTQPKWKQEMAAKGVCIEVRTELANVPEVMANEAELTEALTNLVLNSVDAMPEGGTLTFRCETDETGQSVLLQVQDSGLGMTDEVRRRCLEPFYTTKCGTGAGLGLAMVHGIVRRHGGSVEIVSAPGRGTSATIRLPAGVPLENTAVPAAPPVETVNALRILFIDDEAPVRDLMRAYLAGDNHVVEVAEDGKAGLDRLRDGGFDLVIVDRAMPRMSGHQVAAAVKQADDSMPVIMLTGFGDGFEGEAERISNVDLVLGKPVARDDLRRAVAQVCAAGRRTAERVARS